MDDAVGRVLARVRACGLEENTLVVFLSDNGGPTRELTSSNRPWRGEKGQLLEGGIRVPFILRWPGRVPAGREEARMVSALDIVPTALAAAGVPVPAGLDGIDLVPRLAAGDAAPIHSNLYWRVGGQAAFRSGDRKIHRARGGRWQLYDLARDPGEAEDRAAADPAALAELTAAWTATDAQMAEPLWK
jgi:arylsulfatase B